MSNRIYIPPVRDPTARSLVTPQGVIHRGAVTPPPPSGIVSVVNNAAGGHFFGVIPGGTTQFQICSFWMVNLVNVTSVAAGTSSAGQWFDSFNVSAAEGMLSQTQSSFNWMSQRFSTPARERWEHWIFVYDGTFANPNRHRFYRDGLELGDLTLVGNPSASRTLTQSMRYLSHGNGQNPLRCEGLGEFWLARDIQWTPGDESKFITPGGDPVPLGTIGQGPYGSQPEVFLGGSMSLDDWNNANQLGSEALTRNGGVFEEFIPL